MNTIVKKPLPHKHRVLANSLRSLAASLGPGDRMPSVPELMREFGIASSTVQAAVQTLRREGVLVCRRGSGTFVAERTSFRAQNKITERAAGAPGGTIAVVASHDGLYFHSCVDFLTARAASHSLAVVCRYADATVITIEEVLAMEALNPVGFILFGFTLEWVAKALRERGHRAVIVGVPPAEVFPSVPCVFGDHEHGGYLAARRLLLLGHRRLACACYFAPDPFQTRRWQGHLRALHEAGLAAQVPRRISDDVLRAWQNDPDAVRAYFHGPDSPTGVLAWNDSVAAQICTLLRQAGLRVPADVSVIGYDNMPFGLDMNPSLDTVEPHMDVLIGHALSFLDAPLEAQGVPTALVAQTLVCRKTSAPPGGDQP